MSYDFFQDPSLVSVKADSSGSRALMIDTDGERFAVRLLASPTRYRHLERVRAFPQHKWSAVEGAWMVPLTDPNLNHLFANWTESQIEYTSGARLLVDYHVKTKQVADLKLKERLAFLDGRTVTEPKDYWYATDVPPMGHQKVAFASARRAEYFALLMEMGTGKSKVVVDVLCDRARAARRKWEEQGAKPPVVKFLVLIVAPKTLTGNWLNELAKHTTIDLNVERVKGTRLDRMDRILALVRDRDEFDRPMHSWASVAVINYEGLQALEEQFKLIPWDLMVLDESIMIKNPSAKRTKAAIRVGRQAKSRFILTGLPITKHVVDLYSQFDFLRSGALGYTSFHAYRNRFSEVSYWGDPGEWKREHLPELQERLARFSFIIRRDQCVDLPPKQYQVREIEMTDKQAQVYKAMVSDMIVDIGEAKPQETDPEVDRLVEAAEKGKKGEAPGANRFSIARIVLTQLLRLSQITSGFIKLEDGTLHRFAPNPKLAAVREILEESDDADKFVVWSCFRDDVTLLREELRADFGAVVLQGGMTEEEIEESVRRFDGDPKCRVLAGNQAAGGKGFNLVRARHVIYFANNFNLDHRAQSEDRCHRIGQTGTVLYTDLVVPGTIDELITERLREKRDLADLLTDKTKIVEALQSQLSAGSR